MNGKGIFVIFVYIVPFDY